MRVRVQPKKRIGVAIGSKVLDLSVIKHLLESPHTGRKVFEVFSQPTLNAFMELGPEAWHEVRELIKDLLAPSNPTLRNNYMLMDEAFNDMADCTLHLPFHVRPPASLSVLLAALAIN